MRCWICNGRLRLKTARFTGPLGATVDYVAAEVAAQLEIAISIPLTKPNPAKLSESIASLREMEDRAIFCNFGPISADFEENVKRRMFGGTGDCLTVCNATIALMIAIRHVVEGERGSRRRFALMPSFTFAAAAQAAMWNRLTPLFCDINPLDWSADRASERKLLEKYHEQIAVMVPICHLRLRH